MQLEAISQAIQAYYNVTEIDEENPADSYRSIAMDIKKEFDKKYKPCWHCIVGMINFLFSFLFFIKKVRILGVL